MPAHAHASILRDLGVDFDALDAHPLPDGGYEYVAHLREMGRLMNVRDLPDVFQPSPVRILAFLSLPLPEEPARDHEAMLARTMAERLTAQAYAPVLAGVRVHAALLAHGRGEEHAPAGYDAASAEAAAVELALRARADKLAETKAHSGECLALVVHTLTRNGAVLMCPRCRIGPIFREACGDMALHHGVPDSEHTDNRCPNPKCRYFHGSSDGGWRHWDGYVRIDAESLFPVQSCETVETCEFAEVVGQAPPRRPCWPFAEASGACAPEGDYLSIIRTLLTPDAEPPPEKHLTVDERVTRIKAHRYAEGGWTRVTLHDDITKIEEGAFRANDLRAVRLPPLLFHLGPHAFAKNRITHVATPSTLTVIGKGAFAGNGMTSVSFDSSVERIDGDAFARNRLTEVRLPESLRHIGDSAFAYNRLELLGFGSIGPTSIGAHAFLENRLTSLRIRSELRSIGDGAFARNRLERVELPSSLKKIGDSAFEKNSIRELSLGGGLVEIGADAFMSNRLTELALPQSVRKIGDRAFQGAFQGRVGKVTRVRLTIPDRVQTIGLGAFRHNDIIAEVTLPRALEEQAVLAFDQHVKMVYRERPRGRNARASATPVSSTGP